MEEEYEIHSNHTSYYYKNNETYVQQPMSFAQFWMSSAEYQYATRLKTYVPPVLIICGSVANVLVIIALTQCKLTQPHSVCVYFAAISVINTIVLNGVHGLTWLQQVFQTPDVTLTADWFCRIWSFLLNVLYSLPSWLTTIAIFDRYLTMWHPLKAHSFCTVFIAKVVTAVTAVLVVGICIHALWSTELISLLSHDDMYVLQYCVKDHEQRDFLIVIWPWIEVVLNNYLTMLLVIVLVSCLMVVCIPVLSLQCKQEHEPEQEPDSLQQQRQQLIHATIAVAQAYIVLEMPMIIFNLVDYFWETLDYKVTSQLFLVKEICTILRCLHNALFPVLLFIFLSPLRHAIRMLLRQLTNRGTTRELHGISDANTSNSASLLPKLTDSTKSVTVVTMV